MALGSGDSDQQRMKSGLLVFTVGAALLIFVWLSAMCRGTPPPRGLIGTSTHAAGIDPGPPAATPAGSDAANPPRATPVEKESFVRGAAIALGAGFLLVLMFLIGSYAMVRANRRRMQAAAHVRPPPSETKDAWSMHRVPPYGPDDEEPPDRGSAQP